MGDGKAVGKMTVHRLSPHAVIKCKDCKSNADFMKHTSHGTNRPSDAAYYCSEHLPPELAVLFALGE